MGLKATDTGYLYRNLVAKSYKTTITGIIYTVPAGKIFEGTVTSDNPVNTCNYQLSGEQLTVGLGTYGYVPPVTKYGPGTTFAYVSSSAMVIQGIEYDNEI